MNKKSLKNPAYLVESLKEELNLEPEEFPIGLNTETPPPGRYRWCPACPMFILFAAEDRAKVSASKLVRDSRIILQERAFCYGAAALCKRLLELDLGKYPVNTT